MDSVTKYRLAPRRGAPRPAYSPAHRRPQYQYHPPQPRMRSEREMSDDSVVRHIINPMMGYRYPGAHNLAAHQERIPVLDLGHQNRVPVHPIATYRDPPEVLNMSFDQATHSPLHFDNRLKRHSWSSGPPSHPFLLHTRLKYTYISQVITPARKFEREPWFTAVDFLKNGDVVLLDKENKQIEVHSCSLLPTCRRYVFSHSFKIYKEFSGADPSDIAVYENYIVVIDKGQRCMRVFTSDGKSTGSVKFRNQPRCVAVRGSTFAIAFWDLSLSKGSIVLYKAGIEKVIGHGKKLTLVNPRHVESATECYDSIGLNSHSDVIALSEDGRLFLHSVKSSLQAAYTCCNETILPRVRSMVVKGDVVVLCNTYQDCLTAVGFTQTKPRRFDMSNRKTILNEEDGLYAPRAMAFYGEDLIVVHKYGADVKVFGTVNWSKPKNGFVTFRF